MGVAAEPPRGCAGTRSVYYGALLYKVGSSCYKGASIPAAKEPIMERRILGKTGVELAVLGFGCGAVGGLMVRGTAADQERAVGRALELGINYFDTAPIYGDGESEKNLGRVLKALRPNVIVGTKVRIPDEARGRAGQAVTASLEASLARLGLERVDLLQLHNLISDDGRARTVEATAVLDQVVPALDDLRRQGKIRFFGITALGDTPALHRVIDARVLDTAQVCFNLLNPSAGMPLPPGYPAQDFGRAPRADARGGMGAIGIRVLAGGARSGVEAAIPSASPPSIRSPPAPATPPTSRARAGSRRWCGRATRTAWWRRGSASR